MHLINAIEDHASRVTTVCPTIPKICVFVLQIISALTSRSEAISSVKLPRKSEYTFVQCCAEEEE